MELHFQDIRGDQRHTNKGFVSDDNVTHKSNVNGQNVDNQDTNVQTSKRSERNAGDDNEKIDPPRKDVGTNEQGKTDNGRNGKGTDDQIDGKDGVPYTSFGVRKRRKGRKKSEEGPGRTDSLSAVKSGFETAGNVVFGVFVRLLLIGGNVLAAWRTVEETDDDKYWFLIPICSVLLFIEYSILLYKRKGLEWTWWSPCFLVYLVTTIPLVWQMQLKQRDKYIAQLNSVNTVSGGSGDIASTQTTGSGSDPSSTTASTILKLQDISWRAILAISNDTWVIVVNESLVYLVIFSRWMLPRGEISREFLADMLLEFLAIASDIMELLALFDEGAVREDLMLNYWILIAWSVSFIQFIPVLMHRRKYRRIKNVSVGCLQKACGNNFTEVLATLMAIVLQDGSFFVLRLYIMIHLNIVTYSLTFFVMKNLLSLLLLIYRLGILIHNLPCCCGKKYQMSNSLRRKRTVSYD